MPTAESEKLERKGEDKDPNKIIPEKELFSWKAPSRPFKRKDKEFWVTIIAIAGIGGLILFFVEGFMPVILIIALIFLYYILSTVEPENVNYEITNKGIKISDRRTDWQMLTRFWFAKRLDSELLVFETVNIPGRIEMVINLSDKDKIRKTLLQYLIEEKISPSKLDNVTDWVAKKLPGNK